MMRAARIAFVFLAALTASVRAEPVTYSTPLVLDAGLVQGTINQPAFSPDLPLGAQYHSFSANAGDTIHLYGLRLDGGLDMAFWLFQGMITATEQIGFSFADVPGVAFADDELLPHLPGPYGDPYLKFVAPESGLYTVAVTNYGSEGDGLFSYQLGLSSTLPDLPFAPVDLPPGPVDVLATGSPALSVPEPSSLALATLAGGLWIGGRLRRRNPRFSLPES